MRQQGNEKGFREHGDVVSDARENRPENDILAVVVVLELVLRRRERAKERQTLLPDALGTRCVARGAGEVFFPTRVAHSAVEVRWREERVTLQSLTQVSAIAGV